MKYPDKTEIKLGDIVWWNEGDSIGRIVGIHETEEQCKNAGIVDPGVFICYDGSETEGLFVGYPLRAFDEEGVERLTVEEQAEVNHIIGSAMAFIPEKVRGTTAGLFRNRKTGKEYWNVVFYRNRQAVNVVQVEPFSFACQVVQDVAVATVHILSQRGDF